MTIFQEWQEMLVNQKNCRELQVAAAFTSVMEELVEEGIKFSLSILNHVPILAFPVCCWALLQYQKGRDWPVTLPVNVLPAHTHAGSAEGATVCPQDPYF